MRSWVFVLVQYLYSSGCIIVYNTVIEDSSGSISVWLPLLFKLVTKRFAKGMIWRFLAGIDPLQLKSNEIVFQRGKTSAWRDKAADIDIDILHLARMNCLSDVGKRQR